MSLNDFCSFTWHSFLVLFPYDLLEYKALFCLFLYILRFALWPRMLSILKKVQ
jgi:hypothetical protein